MRQLDHPNIIKLIDFSESKQHYYIILELAPGGELFHQIVRLTYFSEDLSRHVITQVAEALEYLHEEKGVVHRSVYFPWFTSVSLLSWVHDAVLVEWRTKSTVGVWSMSSVSLGEIARQPVTSSRAFDTSPRFSRNGLRRLLQAIPAVG